MVLLSVLYVLAAGFVGMGIEACVNAAWTYVETPTPSIHGRVSVFMFPVYAIGLPASACIASHFLADKPFWMVALSGLLVLWGVELLIGIPCAKLGVRIWDYRQRRGALFDGVICLHPAFWIQWPIVGWLVVHLHPIVCVWHR